MALKLYNTLTRRLEPLIPVTAGKIGIYVCGITAYDRSHLGHARAAVSFDVIVRYLRHCGFEVTFIRNYTDVDDKIIDRAKKEKVGWSAIAEKYMDAYDRDMARLGNLEPDIQPCASEHIPEMIETIKTLIHKGLAYAAGGDVYFAVRKFSSYGKLSGKKIEELEAGARVEIGEQKRDPLDFALWKASKPGEPEWPSPWGPGRPGWHIECSAMSTKYLGQPFDLHGGGLDLIFPHHENEIAQSEGAADRPFARYWLHNGTLTVHDEKMSKSLGNFFTVEAVLAHHHPEVVRYFLLSSHYRSPLDYSEEGLQDAAAALDRFYGMGERLEGFASPPKLPAKLSPAEKATTAKLNGLSEKITGAMDDDFNTAMAFGHIFDAVREINRVLDDPQTTPAFKSWLKAEWKRHSREWGLLFGVFGASPGDFLAARQRLQMGAKSIKAEEVERLIRERTAARAAKDFEKSDRVRAQLLQIGVEIKDNPDGTTSWKVK